ncbi:hypothetical protein EVAR_27480_1 [Eumeta japonica]|uniref:Uncharacterized protein n=1 Tax=Eumeta variegata TaxID=151549 RepID=A0A4C1XEI8_EUMVA|nr:hypothetical protein EVAR_27480_1 [Eumeta japonica]
MYLPGNQTPGLWVRQKTPKLGIELTPHLLGLLMEECHNRVSCHSGWTNLEQAGAGSTEAADAEHKIDDDYRGTNGSEYTHTWSAGSYETLESSQSVLSRDKQRCQQAEAEQSLPGARAGASSYHTVTALRSSSSFETPPGEHLRSAVQAVRPQPGGERSTKRQRGGRDKKSKSGMRAMLARRNIHKPRTNHERSARPPRGRCRSLSLYHRLAPARSRLARLQAAALRSLTEYEKAYSAKIFVVPYHFCVSGRIWICEVQIRSLIRPGRAGCLRRPPERLECIGFRIFEWGRSLFNKMSSIKAETITENPVHIYQNANTRIIEDSRAARGEGGRERERQKERRAERDGERPAHPGFIFRRFMSTGRRSAVDILLWIAVSAKRARGRPRTVRSARTRRGTATADAAAGGGSNTEAWTIMRLLYKFILTVFIALCRTARCSGDIPRVFIEFSCCRSGPFARFTRWDLVYLLQGLGCLAGGGGCVYLCASYLYRMRTGKRNRHHRPDSPDPNPKSKRDDISINQLT